MTAPWRTDLHPRADDGRFGHVAGQHDGPPHPPTQQPPASHTGTFVALGAGTALAGGVITLVGTGHMGRVYRFTRNSMLEDTHLNRVIYGNANLRRLAARMAAGEKHDVSRYFAPDNHTQLLIDTARGDTRFAGDAAEMLPVHKKVGLIKQIIDRADPRDTPHLYRAMYLEQPLRSGDEVDFGSFVSWSSKRTTAEAFGDHLFHLPGGQVKGLRLSDSYLEEWLAGGKYRVVARANDGLDWHYHVAPVGVS